MRNLSVISSLVYVVLTAIYFIFGKSDSYIWSAWFYVNTGLYICLLLIDKAIGFVNIKKISFIITAIVFQILLVSFELYLVIWCGEDYFKLVNNVFWSTIGFIIAVTFVITYKILNKWANS